MAGCLDHDVVAAYVDGALTPSEVAAVEAHLGTCDSCRKDVSALAVVQTMSAQADPADGLELIPGDRIGRYVLSSERARGAMSIVAVAADPELGRDIAIKVLRPELSAQLLRAEARVMAKVSHPNVVAVHDVGEHAGRVYVAMELVDGVDLRRWLGVEQRSWREIVAVMVEAAKGIAAAHDAGIVHRDIKPENVLCGPADRVRVTDFGLASYTVDEATGVTGTPRYLAPELWDGKPATAHSDQWSFCVTLYEALAGTPPFTADSVTALRAAIGREIPSVPSTVPRRLRAILRRGLARDPAARWASMHELATALALRPPRTWIVGAAVVVIAAALAFVAHARPAGNPCDVPSALIDNAWNRGAIETAFRASARPDDARRVIENLDAYGKRWRIARIESCRDARVDGTPVARAVYEARTRCLDRRREDLAALARLLSMGANDHAVEASLALPSLETCDSSAVQAEVIQPLDGLLAPRVEAVDRQIAATRALVLREPSAEKAIQQAHAVLAIARAVGYPPVIARAAILLAHLATLSTDLDATERELDEALVAAAAANDDRGTAEVWTDRITFLAMTRGAPERALDLAVPAEAAVVRVGAPGDLLARLYHARGIAELERNAIDDARTSLLTAREHEEDPLDQATIDIALGTVEMRSGHLPEAHERLTTAIATMEKELGPQHPQVGLALMSLGGVESDSGDYRSAQKTFARSIELIRAGLGENHVAYALALSNLGMAESHGGNPAVARQHLTDAIEKLAALHHRDEYLALANLGNLERHTGQLDEANATWQRAVQLARDAHDPSSERVERALYAIGAIASDQSRNDDALAAFQEALPLAIAEHGENHLRSIEVLESIGMVLSEQDQCARAIAFENRAIAASVVVYGADDPSVARSLSAVGDCMTKLGDKKAVAQLERALAINDSHPPIPPADDAYLRWVLAQAIWKFDRKGHARAIEEAAKARALYAADPDPYYADLVRDIDRWLAARR